MYTVRSSNLNSIKRRQNIKCTGRARLIRTHLWAKFLLRIKWKFKLTKACNLNFDQNFKLEITLNYNFKLEITLNYFFELELSSI